MFKNINYFKVAGPAMKSYMDVMKYLAGADIEPKLKELVLTRASQINGCAYCLNMHTIDALKIGETPQRLHVLAAWRETNLFTKKEKLALELTEKITMLHQNHFEDEFYQRLEAEFTEKEFVDLVILISQINVWNALNITFKMEVDPNYK